MCALILPGGRVVISAVGENKCLESHYQKQARLLPSQLFPFSAIVLSVFENDVARGISWETIEYKLGKAIIQNCFFGT